MTNKDIMDLAKDVFTKEAEAITGLSLRLSLSFAEAVMAVYRSNGKVIVSGIGKSGLIGKKISSTLASIGTPSFFMHPVEAFHGDLGMVDKEDVLLLISNSGETDEVLKIVPFLKNNENTIISMTSDDNSTLAQNSDYHLNVYVAQEACPLQLAPTSSSVAALAMGDAFAVALMKINGVAEEGFAMFHPGGSLGKRLLTRVEDKMRTEDLPLITQDEDMENIINCITTGRFGLAVVIDNDQNIVGIITDGDIRRTMHSKKESFFSLKAVDIMTLKPKTIQKNTKLVDAEKILNENKINSLLITENNKLSGIIQIYDL